VGCIDDAMHAVVGLMKRTDYSADYFFTFYLSFDDDEDDDDGVHHRLYEEKSELTTSNMK